MENISSSSPITKILSSRVGDDGLLYYQVEYMPCWVKEDALSSNQHLVDAFWKFIVENNRNEQRQQQYQSERQYTTNNQPHRVHKLQEQNEESYARNADGETDFSSTTGLPEINIDIQTDECLPCQSSC